ncbi:MAG: fused MFS/spermidine synthase [Bauldia sp.]
MSAQEPAAPAPARAAGRGALSLLVFTAAIFLSACLLFVVEPMFAKMVLPRLGGSPGVWSVAMVFFQAGLLLGYLYAHVLATRLPPWLGLLVHIGVLLAAAWTLPLAVADGWGRPPPDAEEVWLLGLFAASIGLPFFALSANAPLLQAWFAGTGHRSAHDPYFLYAASNIGSFLALLSYPFIIEPRWPLAAQRGAWTYGFYALIALVAASGALRLRARPSPASAPAAAPAAPAPTRGDALHWVALAAIPSGLLVALTAHLSTDVAAAPFLWVVPLALYLLTFALAFQRRPLLPHGLVLRLEPAALAFLTLVVAMPLIAPILVSMAVNLVGFFLVAMACHGELARRRPPASHLTQFYVWLSVGGTVGGLFAGLVAPNVFSSVLEYPLLIVAAALLRPGLRLPAEKPYRWALAAAAVLALASLLPAVVWTTRLDAEDLKFLLGVLLVGALFLARWSFAFAGVVVLVFALARTYGADPHVVTAARSFFGVLRVTETVDGRFRVLYHGTTPHGAVEIRDGRGRPLTGRPTPISYYYDEAPLAQAVRAVREENGGPIRIGVVGLGTGTLACWARPEDSLEFFEIDRKVVDIATNPAAFPFVRGCAPQAKINLGDARLTLADAADGAFDILIVDAFSSDAIPVHLMTTEAMALYNRKVGEGGLIVFHVSNRYLELQSVVAGIGRANGLMARILEAGTAEGIEVYRYPSEVIALARRSADFGTLTPARGWRVKNPRSDEAPWSDDYANVFGAMLRRAGGSR